MSKLYRAFVEKLCSSDERLNELNRLCNTCNKHNCKFYENRFYVNCKYKNLAIYLTYLSMRKKYPKELLLDLGFKKSEDGR